MEQENNETPQQALEINNLAEVETEALDDLPVKDDEQVKGGPGGLGGFNLNHIETTASDEDEDEDEDEVEALADLPVENDEQVTGGHYLGTANGGVWKITSGN